MSDLNQILDEILNNSIYSTVEQQNQGETGRIESELQVRSSNDEVPNSNESDDDDELKTTKDKLDDETENVLQRNLQPRRSRRKSEENDDEDDCQHVPNVNVNEKNKTYVDDENNRDHPTYVPRKGKFFEHDDRTSNEQKSTTKQETPRGKVRSHRDAEGKWPHDLYFRDQQVLKSTRHAVRPGHFANRIYQSNHSDDHLPSISRRPPGFTTKQEQHSTHYHRKFINRQYQQTDKGSGQQHRRERQQSLPSTENNEKEQLRKANRPVEIKTQQRSSRPKSHHENLENRTKLVHHVEQPKRYSNMRQTLTHSRLQQPANLGERHDWPQVPLSPLTFFSQQTKTPAATAYWYPQTSPDMNTGQSPQVSRYFPTASAFQDQ